MGRRGEGMHTSGGPVLSDCMAQPSICSSRSVNAAPEAAAGVPESLSDMLVMVGSS
jgi:hypothetical protein